MQDLLSMLHALHRPRLLMRAARIGAEDYRRDSHLHRLLGHGKLPPQGKTMMKLIELEADLNAQRLDNDSSYSLVRHVDVLIALVGEARILRTSQLDISFR